MMPMQNQQPLSASVFNDHSMSNMSSAQSSQMQNMSSQQPMNNNNNNNNNNFSNNQFPALPNKVSFVSMFENLYDQIESVNRLRSTLEEQIRKSTALLQTLQASGQMIEGLVRSHFREMQVQYGEKFGAALTDLNRRLIDVEESHRRLTNNPQEISRMKDFKGFGPMSAQPGNAPQTILNSPIEPHPPNQNMMSSNQQNNSQVYFVIYLVNNGLI